MQVLEKNGNLNWVTFFVKINVPKLKPNITGRSEFTYFLMIHYLVYFPWGHMPKLCYKCIVSMKISHQFVKISPKKLRKRVMEMSLIFYGLMVN